MIFSAKNIREPVTESFFINKNDFYYNFDRFTKGESNVLLITGLSGSGKSTLASSLSSKYHAEYIELDLFEHCGMFQNDDQLKQAGLVFYEYLTTHKALHIRLKNRELTSKELGDEIYKFVKYCISWCSRHKDMKWIIEGIQIYEVYKEKAPSYPIVIKNTSTLTSIYRKCKREDYTYTDFVKSSPKLLSSMIKSERELNKLRKELN